MNRNADMFSQTVFTKELTWRWCFWINLPIVGFAFIMLFFVYRTPSDPSVSSGMVAARFWTTWQALSGIDWTGSTLLACTVVCLILPVTLGGNYWPWASAQVPILLVVSLGTLLGLIANEFFIE